MRPAEEIEKKVRQLRFNAEAQTHDRIFGNVMQALDKYEKQKGLNKPYIWRTIMKNPITKLAAAAVIIIAAIVVINQLGIPVENSAFAQVAGRLRTARTLTYKVTTNSSIEMNMAFKEPGYMRITMPGGYVTVADWTQGKALSIIPPRQQFYEMELESLADDPARQLFDSIEKLRTLPDKADEILGAIEEDGRELLGFRVTQNSTINTVWIDSETQELIRVETEFINAPGMSAVMTDYQFNVDLDDSLFSLIPPAGYKRMDIQVNASEITEQDLIEYLRLWSSWTRDNSFPPTFNPIELQKVAMEMERQDRFAEVETSEQETMQGAMQMTRGIMFVMQLPADSNWRYTGENVRFGESEVPIFWYKPAGSGTYRVIYGDLHVEDVTPENLPE